jgi:hypothetical protein
LAASLGTNFLLTPGMFPEQPIRACQWQIDTATYGNTELVQ